MRACQRKWGVSLIPETDPHDQGINLLVYYCLSWGTHVKANPQPLTLNKKDIKEQMQLPVFNTPLWSLWGSFDKHKLEELNMKIQSTSDSYNMQKKNPTKQEWLTASILVRKGNWSIPRLGCQGKISLILGIHLSPTTSARQEQHLCWGSKDGLKWMLGYTYRKVQTAHTCLMQMKTKQI